MDWLRTTTSKSGFWTTIDLLIDRDWRDKHGETYDEYELRKNLLKNLKNSKLAKLKKNAKANWSIYGGNCEESNETLLPRIPINYRSSFGNQQQRKSIIDRNHMQQLRDHVQLLAEEALQKRIADRQTDEMERLKRLMLSGKTPLKDCPPELRDHPVFVFWRVVDKEVQKMTRSRADAYYKKMRKMRRKGTHSESGTLVDSEDSNLSGQSDQSFPKQDFVNEKPTRKNSETKQFSTQTFSTYRYEDEGVKKLKELMTVEELYQMADQIIGYYKEFDFER